ncbi:hypothetical protein Q5752_001306 [Cryptotrichosporon argae]
MPSEKQAIPHAAHILYVPPHPGATKRIHALDPFAEPAWVQPGPPAPRTAEATYRSLVAGLRQVGQLAHDVAVGNW